MFFSRLNVLSIYRKPKGHSLLGGFAFCAAALVVSVAGRASPIYTPITNFTTTGDIQTNLIQQVPTGAFVTSNAFATPFNIPAGQNFGEAAKGTVTASVGLADVTDVYTLINGYAPVSGDVIGTLTFSFSDGAQETQTLVGGSNIRDFFQGTFANTLSSSNAENAFTFSNTTGGAGTDNASTGASGTYLVDEQDWSIGDSSTLTSVALSTAAGNLINGGTGNGSPILLGLTVEQQVPEPSIASLLVVSLGAAIFTGRHRRRV